jgi:hypothetical protein
MGLLYVEQLIRGHLFEYDNVKWHFAQEVGYAAAVNEVYHPLEGVSNN